MRENPLPPRHRAYPLGIVRHDERFALDRDGAVILLSGRVAADDGATYLPFLVQYELDERLPATLILGDKLLMEAFEAPLPFQGARRHLLLSGPDGKQQELWSFLEPARIWMVVADPAWIAAFLAKTRA